MKRILFFLCLTFAFLLNACSQAPFYQWSPTQVLDAFKSAGLEVDSPRSLTPDEFGILPVAPESSAFKIPSLGEKG